MSRRTRREGRKRPRYDPVRTLDRYIFGPGEADIYASNDSLPRSHDRRPPVILPDDVDPLRTIAVSPTAVRQFVSPIEEKSRAARWSFTPVQTLKQYWREAHRPVVNEPENVRFCVRRTQRREVLFAMRVAGRRGGSPGKRGKYRRSIESNYSC